MTSTNTSWKNNPFLLGPAGKDYIWGGTRLKAEYSKDLPMTPLAESWECSTHPDGPSIVASGEFKGMTLTKVLEDHPEFMGTHSNKSSDLPILIKIIDAKQDLSIQVHPDDTYARKYENGQLGKTEMWYVMDASKDAKLVYGFNRDMTIDMVLDSLKDGTIEKYLQKVTVHKDDVFYVEPGTVHAIGAGVLIAEIQQSSNLTYRLYDYGRIDKNGKQRELHVDKAYDVMNLKSSAKPLQPMRTLKYKSGSATELLCRCKYFQVDRFILNTQNTRKLVDFQTQENTFKILLCIDGCGTIFNEDETSLNYFKGDCIFVPARSPIVRLHGKAQFLLIGC